MPHDISRKELGQRKLPVRTVPMSSIRPSNAQLWLPAMNTAAAALSALPLFGGAEEDETATGEKPVVTEKKTVTETKKPAESSTTTSAGGSTGTSPDQMTPEQISSLLEQVNTLTSQTQELTGKLSGYEAKEEEAARAAMSREEALQKDYEKAAQTIVQMDNALKRQALINAINSFEDLKFHDSEFLLHEIDPTITENMMVDLERGTVTVTGVENELRRIAKEKSWLVKNVAGANDSRNGGGPKPPRPTGAPPAGGRGNQGNNQQRREEIIARFSSLTGRR